MPTQLDLYNEALGILRQERMTVVSPAETTSASRAMNQHWRAAVRQGLEKGDWDFAKKRAALSRSGTVPVMEFAYYYDLPAECARVTWVSETGVRSDVLPPGGYELEPGKLATNAETVFVKFISYEAVDTPGLWTSLFLRYAGLILAHKAIKLNPGVLKAILEEMPMREAEAEGLDAVQDSPSLRRPGSWSTANRRHSRGGSRGGLPEFG